MGGLEVEEGWGARLEAVVHGRVPDPVLHHRFESIRRIDYTNALGLDPPRPWKGKALAIILDKDNWELVNDLLPHWQPLVVVLAYPSGMSRRQLVRMTPKLGGNYTRKMLQPTHQAHRGVSRFACHLVHFTQDNERKEAKRESLMTPPTY